MYTEKISVNIYTIIMPPSGLLPRNQETTDTGNFTNLAAQTLVVSGAGFINNLSVNAFSPASITTSSISGDPNLALTGTTVTINGSPTITADSTDTLTNKSIASDTNTITISSVGGDNINDILDQRLTTLNSPSFLGLSTVGAINAGGAGTFSQVLTAAINDPGLANTALINGVNPLTTATTLANNVDQDVRTTASPTWNTINVDQIAGLPIIISGVNFNAFVSGVNASLNQNVSTSASPTFAGLTLTGLANNNAITNILGIDGSNVVQYKNNVADISTAQTLTNKTLTAPIISTISNTGTLTLPTSTDTLVGRATTDTLTNKTIASTANTLTIGGTNVNSLINQDVRTTASPTFTSLLTLTQTGNTSFTIGTKADLAYANAGGAYFTSAAIGDICLRNTDNTKLLNLGVGNATAQVQIGNTTVKNVVTSVDDYTNLTTKAKSAFPISTTSAAGATTTLLTIPVPTNTSVAIFMYLSARKLSGTVTGYASYIYDWKAINNAGTVTTTIGNNQAKSEQSIAGSFGGNITPAVSVSTTNVLVTLANIFADGTLTEAGYIEVLFS